MVHTGRNTGIIVINYFAGMNPMGAQMPMGTSQQPPQMMGNQPVGHMGQMSGGQMQMGGGGGQGQQMPPGAAPVATPTPMAAPPAATAGPGGDNMQRMSAMPGGMNQQQPQQQQMPMNPQQQAPPPAAAGQQLPQDAPRGPFTQPQLHQLRAQIYAYKLLARNQPLPDQIKLAVEGKARPPNVYNRPGM